MKTVSLEKLNSLLDVPFELWISHGVSLRAVSANANGKVNSGKLKNGIFFSRVWKNGVSRFIFN